MPQSLTKLIQIISFLPWIGEKTATKLAFFLLNANTNFLQNFAELLLTLKQSVDKCKTCWALVDNGVGICSICSSLQRNKDIICVVEEYFDMMTIENTKWYTWVYHILWWAISPMNGIFVWDLNFESLFERIWNAQKNIELILAMNPNIEWEATLQYIISQIEKRGLKKFVLLTRLSRWLSSWYIEYADNITLLNSLKERKKI